MTPHSPRLQTWNLNTSCHIQDALYSKGVFLPCMYCSLFILRMKSLQDLSSYVQSKWKKLLICKIWHLKCCSMTIFVDYLNAIIFHGSLFPFFLPSCYFLFFYSSGFCLIWSSQTQQSLQEQLFLLIFLLFTYGWLLALYQISLNQPKYWC